jgi:hypothetical protein
MKLRIFFIIIFALFKLSASAQDSLLYDLNNKMAEGIFLNYEDFRRNNPVTKSQIENNLNKELLDYFGKSLDPEKFVFSRNGEKITVASKTVWGFYQNNTLHINYRGNFYRVPVFGSISYLMATIEVISPNYYYPSYGGMGGIGGSMGTTMKTQEVREFLINFYDGIVTPFSMDQAERLLNRDPAVYAEFKALKRKQQKEQVSRYFRKYNELHPVYFLK